MSRTDFIPFREVERIEIRSTGRGKLLLLDDRVNAIVPPSKSDRPVPGRLAGEPLAVWVRGVLALLAVGLVAVFVTARFIVPYAEDGTPLRMASHQQLGLPPCTFSVVTGVPCPSCGMTTSFALLARGDVSNSARANWVGTLLAAFCMLVLPWIVVSVALGRAIFVRSLERALILVVMSLLVLMFARWVVVLALMWWNGTILRP
jgi:hypothetical protein